jgi:NADH-quinone oxidoreductase subunit C
MPDEIETSLAVKQLRELNPEAVEEARAFRGEVTVYIRPQSLHRMAEFLRDAPQLLFEFLADVTAVDLHPNEPRFEVIYHLLSIEKNARLRLKVRLPGSDPRVESMVPVWPAANAFEREVFDLFGIVFEGHPYLRRILMPEDWQGHPLRKDYPVQGDVTRWP